ncbi:hypothetical protein JZO80_07720 [Vagococcus fluvialis]|uniref:hypothetical protein n=1 Tax=Vagococcus fluvialis TaxID=2738 RepID=UPI001A8E6758|nr:hypothetical protein [Vagococcus fluvialis]MBO0420051.1 hypothetical protein [Vagococcus fluvialis]
MIEIGLLDSKLEKGEKDNLDLIISNIEELSDEEKEYISESLVEISQGRDSFYSIQTISKKINSFLKKQDTKTVNGAISEFILVCLLRKNNFSQEYCFRNLEENSIKKGFDGLYLKNDIVWLAESKSTATLNQHKNSHKHTIDLGYKGLCNQISGKTTNDPWENAVSHTIAAKSERTLISQLTKLSEDYMDNKYVEIEQQNIILGSTIITSKINDIEKNKNEIEKLLDKHKVNQELVVIINLTTNELFLDFFKEVSK